MLAQLLYGLKDHFFGFNVFKYITFRAILSSLTALILCFLTYPYLIKWLKNKSIGQVVRNDGPSSHFDKTGTPTMGGILILTGLMGSVILWMKPGAGFYLLLWIIFSFGLIGFVDDYLKIKRKDSRGIGGKWKFILQIIFSVPVALFIYYSPDYNTRLVFPFFKNLRPDLEIFYIPFAIFVIVGASNAVNLTDGLDGLAIGPIMTTAGVYGVFSYVAGHAKFADYLGIEGVAKAGELAVFCSAIVGGGLGFLWYNTYPAMVFMGDVGSLPIGASIATVALLVKQEIILAVAGGVFVVEAISVIMQVVYFKTTEGKRIFRMAPIHHHFEMKGWPEPRITVRFWIVSIILALVALSTLKLR